MLDNIVDLDKSTALYKWLNSASTLLDEAYKTRRIAKLPNYFSREVCIRVERDIMSDNPMHIGVVATKKNRWKVAMENDSVVKVFILVDYSEINVGRGIFTDCETDRIDLWVIQKESEKYICKEIRRVKQDEFE